MRRKKNCEKHIITYTIKISNNRFNQVTISTDAKPILSKKGHVIHRKEITFSWNDNELGNEHYVPLNITYHITFYRSLRWTMIFPLYQLSGLL